MFCMKPFQHKNVHILQERVQKVDKIEKQENQGSVGLSKGTYTFHT